MPLQMRTYTLKSGNLDAWTRIWQEQIRPVREGLGFTVPAAWTVPENDQFIWLMAYDGEDWAERDAAFHASPERRAMQPDPAELILRIDTCWLETVS